MDTRNSKQVKITSVERSSAQPGSRLGSWTAAILINSRVLAAIDSEVGEEQKAEGRQGDRRKCKLVWVLVDAVGPSNAKQGPVDLERSMVQSMQVDRVGKACRQRFGTSNSIGLGSVFHLRLYQQTIHLNPPVGTNLHLNASVLCIWRSFGEPTREGSSKSSNGNAIPRFITESQSHNGNILFISPYHWPHLKKCAYLPRFVPPVVLSTASALWAMIEQVDKYSYTLTLRNMVTYPAFVLAKWGWRAEKLRRAHNREGRKG